MLPTGTSFLTAFLAFCSLEGFRYPSILPLLTQLEEHLRRQANILANARTAPHHRPYPTLARILRAQVLELRSVVTPAALAALGDALASRLCTPRMLPLSSIHPAVPEFRKALS